MKSNVDPSKEVPPVSKPKSLLSRNGVSASAMDLTRCVLEVGSLGLWAARQNI